MSVYSRCGCSHSYQTFVLIFLSMDSLLGFSHRQENWCSPGTNYWVGISFDFLVFYLELDRIERFNLINMKLAFTTQFQQVIYSFISILYNYINFIQFNDKFVFLHYNVIIFFLQLLCHHVILLLNLSCLPSFQWIPSVFTLCKTCSRFRVELFCTSAKNGKVGKNFT